MPGQWYEFFCDVQALSDPPGDLGVFVGINPWNDGIFHRTMVWGREQVGDSGWIYGEFVRVTVTAQAYTDHIRVAVASNPKWAVRDQTVYVDACSIRGVGGPPVELTPTTAPTTPPVGGAIDYDEIERRVRKVINESRLQAP